jgi:hypothetical protein
MSSVMSAGWRISVGPQSTHCGLREKSVTCRAERRISETS